MQTPVDYPIDDRAHTVKFSVDELIYATRLDRIDTAAHVSETAIIDAPVFSQADTEPPAASHKPRLQPFAVFAQTLLSFENGARSGDRDDHGMFSRWSRALR